MLEDRILIQTNLSKEEVGKEGDNMEIEDRSPMSNDNRKI